MIAHIGNRPALQIGRHQVLDYDTRWLDAALVRAAKAAGLEDFPFVEEIRSGVERYLEMKCPLRLLPLEELFGRMRQMLVKIGCDHIADNLAPVAPPVTVSLMHAAREAGNGFELAFFETLRSDLADLRAAGVEEIRFCDLRESVMILRGAKTWNRRCETLMREVEDFLQGWESTRAAEAAAA